MQKNLSDIKLRFSDLFFVLFLIIYFGYLLFTCFREYIWVDEGYSLMTSSQTVTFAFKKAIQIEFQPPLFYVLLNLWRNINHSIYFARLLSILLLFISIFPIKALFKQLFGDRYKIFTIVFLSNTFVIGSALEIRYPTLMILFTVLTEYLFLTGYFRSKPKPSQRLLYIVVALLGVYTQYYFSFLLIANFVVLIAKKKYQESFSYILDMIWPILGLLLLLPHFSSQVSYQSSICQPEFSLYYYVKFFAQSFLDIIMSFPKAAGNNVRFIILATIISLLIAPVFISSWKSVFQKVNQNGYFLKIIVLMLLFAVMITVLKYETLPIRHLIIVFISFWILCFSILNLFKTDKLLYLFSLIIIGISLGYTVYKNQNYPKGHEFKAVIDYIEENEKPGQDLVVYRNLFSLVLKPGYNGPNIIKCIPQEIDYSHSPDYYNWSIKNYNEVDSVFQYIDTEIIWLISTDNAFIKEIYCVDYHDEILEEFILNHYSVLLEKKIGEITIRKLRRLNK
jgi:hypothetical protein